MRRREIGGYLELERNHGSLWHEQAIALNCGRACLQYLIELHTIESILIPDYMCQSVYSVCKACNVTVETYSIGFDFLPLWNFKVKEGQWLYLCDYYGQLSDECVTKALDVSSGRLIIDEAQNYFARPRQGIDTLYTCRKFFGVSDGGFLYTNSKIERELPIDRSMDRLGFVLGRFEIGSEEYLPQAQHNNAALGECGLRSMSALTKNLLRGIDYEAAITSRNANYSHMELALSDKNSLRLNPVNGPFAYPLLVNDGPRARRALAKRGVFVPTLWPNVLEDVSKESVARIYAKNILPLPIDQRYGIDDMDYVLEALEKEEVI